ncbi:MULTISPECIES: ankyrin repeat domain-containing protein [unclassified Wolbachia]|uniref:ankyrin repeat domain-containing protein n=1 Tax=unclassified Wolbachia TaxID=2640676 RepID=UPI002220929E|nr:MULTISPECIES: ankyrin repeat domain-containing protein [unclassified Wolbachia]
MLGKENIGEQVADNQMDYVDAGSAIVDYENILSSEELQCGRSQESPRVTRSSSIGSSSTSTDDEEMFSCISITSDEIVKKATFFVKTFVKEFEEKLSECSKEAKPGSKVRKTGKVVAKVVSTVGNYIPPSVEKVGTSQVMECVSFVSTNQHRKKAKIFSTIVAPSEGNLRKILIEAGLEIFQSFEKQFTKIVDTNQLSCNRGIEKLAMDTVSRVINYTTSCNEKGEFPNLHITKGVILGKSKRKYPFTTRTGHQVKDKQSGEMLMTSELYEKVGIEKAEGEIIKYYQLNEHEKYGYRLPFTWELENWEELEQKYVLSATSKKREYVRILDEEKKKGLASSILKEINENDSAKKKDIQELREEIRNLRILHEKEGKNTFSFNLGYLPKFFIKREVMLDELKKKLDSKNQEVEMSRVVLINGKHGTGKSELAKNCVYSKKNDWKKIAWIDATTYSTLSQSFRNLAKELEIPTENDNDMDFNVVRDREIESIVQDVYQYFRDVKSLFIFDNTSKYKEIEKFLPSYFPNLFFHGEKPYVLITSRSKNWEKEIEKTQLNDGFSLGEAITFIERALGIKDKLENRYLVELAEALNYLPLALVQGAAYIKQEKISISEYLKRYNEAIQKSNPDLLEALGITKELFTTLKLNLNKIRREKNVGQQSHDIVSYMAYLDPNQIDIEEIFLQKKSEKGKQQVLDALNLLNKFSVIELEESIARVHKGIQKTVRVEKERTGIEEETLREIMTSFCLTNPNHVKSVWSHASKYSRLVNEFIDSIYDGGTILHLLAKDGNEKVIKLILEKIYPDKLSKVINAIDEKNFTSLDYAIIHGHLGTVQHLVRKGGDVNLNNTKGMNPLHFAAVYGHLDIAKYLVAQGAIIKSLNKDSMCPLHFAAIYGHLDIIKYLVEEGASINIKDKNNMRPLHFAVIYGRLDIVKYLVEKRANINLRSKEGESTLHFAVMHGQLDIVEYLIEKGAIIDRQNEKNMSPLDYVIVYSNSEEIIYYLEDMHLAPDLKTQSHKRNLETFDEHTLPKKRKLKNISEALQFEDKSTVNLTHRSPISSFNSVSVQPANKDLRL